MHVAGVVARNIVMVSSTLTNHRLWNLVTQNLITARACVLAGNIKNKLSQRFFKRKTFEWCSISTNQKLCLIVAV